MFVIRPARHETAPLVCINNKVKINNRDKSGELKIGPKFSKTKTILLFQEYSTFCVFIPINLPKTSLRSLNIMIHNMGQFTQRLRKNRVCCFLPRHNVTSENTRQGTPRISEGLTKTCARLATPLVVSPMKPDFVSSPP